MYVLAIATVILGTILAIASAIWFYIEIFKTGALWGVAALGVPAAGFLGVHLFKTSAMVGAASLIVPIVWMATHMDCGIKPFLGIVAGVALLYYGNTQWHP